ncbi:MAG: N-acetylneuraminate synthase family protein [Phycisphaerae bacterium]
MRRSKPKVYWSSSTGVLIGHRTIGPGEPVYIIAEAGVNHNGRADTARKLVDAAKRAGADAIKFQVFTAENLVIPNSPTATYQNQQGHVDQRKMLRQLELTRQEFTDLYRYCKEVGIEFLATPFSIDDLEFVLELGVSAIKLASPDLVNVPLLEKAILSNLPVIVSTGASTIEEIDDAVDCFSNHGSLSRLILFHCISSYPTPLSDTNLAVIGNLAQRFPVPVGFSDHTSEWITGALAVAAGAVILEKHFTLDRLMPGPDQALSLDETQMGQYISSAKEAQMAMGTPQRRLLPCEHEVRNVSRGSLVSTIDIPSGTILTPAMLTVKRPGGGIEPARIKDVMGTRALAHIPADTKIDWTMIQLTASESEAIQNQS